MFGKIGKQKSVSAAKDKKKTELQYQRCDRTELHKIHTRQKRTLACESTQRRRRILTIMKTLFCSTFLKNIKHYDSFSSLLRLERSARGRHLIVITVVFPASTKDSSLSTIVSAPDSLTAYQASL